VRFAVVHVGGEGSTCVRISRPVFCKVDAISEFAVSAEDCGEIDFLTSWACNFWMVGVIHDFFLTNAFVYASLVSVFLRRLEWYRVRGKED